MMGYYAALCPIRAKKLAAEKKGYCKHMAAMTRKEARAEAFRLLFETEFRTDASPEEVYALSKEEREFAEDDYIRTVYFGVREHLEEIDEIIVRHSNGWKPSRITPISRSAIRLCIYEMKYMDDIPNAVSINEAIELVKTFDDLKMRTFVNGVLHGAKTELEEAGV
jgi:N utilization substance protein B